MEHIGFIKAPIDDDNLVSLRQTMQEHGATFYKATHRDPADKWWIILFPQGTLREKHTSSNNGAIYTIFFPDGYHFHFDAGQLNREGTWKRDPIILPLETQQEVQP